MIPTYPSGIVDNISIIENLNVLLKKIKESVKNILKVDSIVNSMEDASISLIDVLVKHNLGK